MSEDVERPGLPPDRLTTLWRRAMDHRIAQWTVGYVAVAYGIQHAVTLTSEAYDWPHAAARISMTLLALGLPLAMTLAWYHGRSTAQRISGGEMAIVLALFVLTSLVFYLFVRPANDSISIARTTVAPPANGISLAVLPFVNLSSDKEQEFFSDGITEEITSALAKVQKLRVVARTSAFEFKGKNEDVRQMGLALGATHLIEGSVRKDGNQVRITAQLIRADDGTHLWTESYDRELKAVFEVQEEVARAIAASLQVPLGLKQGESLVSSRIADTDSYQDYLRAKALFRSREARGAPQAESLLEGVVARNPDYAAAWGLLAEVYSHVPNLHQGTASAQELRRITETTLQKVRAASAKALQLDPRSADAYLALAYTEESHGLWLEAEQSFKQGFTLDPLNPDGLSWYREFLGATGRVRDAVAVGEQLSQLEPLVPVFTAVTATGLWVAGENEKALSVALGMPPGFFRGTTLPRIYATMGRNSEAADVILSLPRELNSPDRVEAAIRILRAVQPAPGEKLPYLAELSFVYLYTSHPELALEFYEHEVDAGWFPAHDFMVLPQADYASARKSVRFKNLMRKSGLVEYWRAKGWAPQCHPTTGDDFECN